MAPQFNFERLQILNRTARFTFFQIEGEPYLDVVHAGESNKPYFNALLKRSRRNLQRVRAGAIDATTLAENRKEDRALYPLYVVKGWGCQAGAGFVLDADKNQIPFSQENVSSFLQQLPDWLFEELRRYVAEEANFLDENEAAPSVEDVSGN